MQFTQSTPPVSLVATITRAISAKIPIGIVQGCYPTSEATQHHQAIAHCKALYDLTPFSLQTLASDIERGALSHVIVIVNSRMQFIRVFEYLTKAKISCSMSWLKWHIDSLYLAQSTLLPCLIADLLGHQWMHSVECAAASSYHILDQSKLPLRLICIALHSRKLKHSVSPDLTCYFPDKCTPYARALLCVHGEADLAPGIIRLCHEWRGSHTIQHFHHVQFPIQPPIGEIIKADRNNELLKTTFLISGQIRELTQIAFAIEHNAFPHPLPRGAECLLLPIGGPQDGLITLKIDTDTMRFFAESQASLQGLPPFRPLCLPISKSAAIISVTDPTWWAALMSQATQWEASWTWWPTKIAPCNSASLCSIARNKSLKVKLSSPIDNWPIIFSVSLADQQQFEVDSIHLIEAISVTTGVRNLSSIESCGFIYGFLMSCPASDSLPIAQRVLAGKPLRLHLNNGCEKYVDIKFYSGSVPSIGTRPQDPGIHEYIHALCKDPGFIHSKAVVNVPAAVSISYPSSHSDQVILLRGKLLKHDGGKPDEDDVILNTISNPGLASHILQYSHAQLPRATLVSAHLLLSPHAHTIDDQVSDLIFAHQNPLPIDCYDGSQDTPVILHATQRIIFTAIRPLQIALKWIDKQGTQVLLNINLLSPSIIALKAPPWAILPDQAFARLTFSCYCASGDKAFIKWAIITASKNLISKDELGGASTPVPNPSTPVRFPSSHDPHNNATEETARSYAVHYCKGCDISSVSYSEDAQFLSILQQCISQAISSCCHPQPEFLEFLKSAGGLVAPLLSHDCILKIKDFFSQCVCQRLPQLNISTVELDSTLILPESCNTFDLGDSLPTCHPTRISLENHLLNNLLDEETRAGIAVSVMILLVNALLMHHSFTKHHIPESECNFHPAHLLSLLWNDSFDVDCNATLRSFNGNSPTVPHTTFFEHDSDMLEDNYYHNPCSTKLPSVFLCQACANMSVISLRSFISLLFEISNLLPAPPPPFPQGP